MSTTLRSWIRLRTASSVSASVLLLMFLLPRLGRAEQALGPYATIDIPRKARLEPPRQAFMEQPDWVGFRFDRFHSWALGGGTPYRANLFVNLHRTGAPESSYDDALRKTERELNGGFDEWKSLEKDARWDIGQGRYLVNSINEPTWRLSYRDPERRVSLLWQVYQKDWALKDAKAALKAMADSVQRRQEPDFAEIAERPGKLARQNERNVVAALDWVEARGFPRPQADVPMSHQGLLVEYREDPERRLSLVRPIVSKPGMPLPAYVSWGWRTWNGEAWEDQMPNGDYYPSPGIRKLLEATQSKPGPHYFLIRTLRLEEMEAADYHLQEFYDFVRKYPVGP